MRKRIYAIVESAENGDRLSAAYDYVMMAVIVASLIPLAFKGTTGLLSAVERIATAIFILDYLLRLATADLKLKKGGLSFVLYPFTPLAIIDLLCILPSFNLLSAGFRLLKIIRLFRAFRVFRVFKLFRYSKSLRIILKVIASQKAPLVSVGVLAVGYVLIAALVIFNVEPDTFGTFFDAVYWATVSLTTVGYGDIYPVSVAGRIVTMLSSFVGIAIVALPSGIITAGYMTEINHRSEDKTPSEQP
ncbi:MAG: ion transporter [Oscillospiraceae bacterium]|nr:ion transporter [Oscillospiraceae bacterium]